MNRILLIDDDAEVLEINEKYLTKRGYMVETAGNATEGYEKIKKSMPDCILLDVMMPKIDGYSACKEYRKIANVPIIFLTGKASEEDKIHGLMLGADDYMVKPYSLKELEARIMVNIRRYKMQTMTDNVLSFPPLTINTTMHKVFYNDEEISLSNREYEVLLYLLQNVNQTVTFEQIGMKLWGTYQDADRRSIMVHMSRLRKKIESYVGLEHVIETVWSEGYQYKYTDKQRRMT